MCRDNRKKPSPSEVLIHNVSRWLVPLLLGLILLACSQAPETWHWRRSKSAKRGTGQRGKNTPAPEIVPKSRLGALGLLGTNEPSIDGKCGSQPTTTVVWGLETVRAVEGVTRSLVGSHHARARPFFSARCGAGAGRARGPGPGTSPIELKQFWCQGISINMVSTIKETTVPWFSANGMRFSSCVQKRLLTAVGFHWKKMKKIKNIFKKEL